VITYPEARSLTAEYPGCLLRGDHVGSRSARIWLKTENHFSSVSDSELRDAGGKHFRLCGRHPSASVDNAVNRCLEINWVAAMALGSCLQ